MQESVGINRNQSRTRGKILKQSEESVSGTRNQSRNQLRNQFGHEESNFDSDIDNTAIQDTEKGYKTRSDNIQDIFRSGMFGYFYRNHYFVSVSESC